MIMCPVKGVPVPTGLAMDEGSFAGLTVRSSNVQCSACGQVHPFEGAFLEEPPKAAPEKPE